LKKKLCFLKIELLTVFCLPSISMQPSDIHAFFPLPPPFPFFFFFFWSRWTRVVFLVSQLTLDWECPPCSSVPGSPLVFSLSRLLPPIFGPRFLYSKLPRELVPLNFVLLHSILFDFVACLAHENHFTCSAGGSLFPCPHFPQCLLLCCLQLCFFARTGPLANPSPLSDRPAPFSFSSSTSRHPSSVDVKTHTVSFPIHQFHYFWVCLTILCDLFLSSFPASPKTFQVFSPFWCDPSVPSSPTPPFFSGPHFFSPLPPPSPLGGGFPLNSIFPTPQGLAVPGFITFGFQLPIPLGVGLS